MSKYRYAAAFTACAMMAYATNVGAQDYLTLGVGDFNFDKSSPDHAIWYEAEYRGNYIWDKFLPIVGVGGNKDGVIYGYVGTNYDWNVTGNWYFIPSVTVGAYREDGGKHLGDGLEFRPSLEADYQFDCGYRAGIALHHISNARFGHIDPGVEILEATVSVPFGNITSALR